MTSVLLLLAGALVVFLARILKAVVPRWLSPFNRLRGPPSGHWLFGNFIQVGSDYPHLHAKWFEEYGPTMRTTGMLNVGSH